MASNLLVDAKETQQQFDHDAFADFGFDPTPVGDQFASSSSSSSSSSASSSDDQQAGTTTSLLRLWISLMMWSLKYHISLHALAALLSILAYFLRVFLGALNVCPSLFVTHLSLGARHDADHFTKYVACSKCFSLYDLVDLHGRIEIDHDKLVSWNCICAYHVYIDI